MTLHNARFATLSSRMAGLGLAAGASQAGVLADAAPPGAAVCPG